MNTNTQPDSIVFHVAPMDSMRVVGYMEEYRSKMGDNVASLAHALGLGTLMADYHLELTEFDHANPDSKENLEEIYMQFRTGTFIDQHGGLVRPGFTVGINDRVNKRDIYILVGMPGHNVVFYQLTPDNAKVTKIGLLAHDNMRRALRMSPEWKDGNNHDKVMMCSLIGFDYDRNDDEIIVPHGRLESGASLGRDLAVSGL